MKKNDWILIISVIIYSWMFYQQTPGINFLIFSVALIILLIWRNTSLLKDGSWYLAASGTIISGVCVALFGTAVATVANVVSLSLLSAYSISRKSSVLLAGLYSLYSFASAIGFMIADLVRRKTGPDRSSGGRFWIRLGIGAGILIVIIVFFILYQRSNPLFLDLTRKIKLDFISWPWVRFTFLGFILLYGFFYHRNFPAWLRWDSQKTTVLNPEVYAIKENRIFGRNVQLSWEIYSGIILIALLNVLLLVVNVLDVYYLWITNVLPSGMTYSDYVHQGIGNLIVSIALAILIILFFFRGHINFAEKSKTFKIITYIWIIQNILVLVSTAYRNYLYISEYSLTYKRIGVYLWLILTLVGLVTTFVKISGKKSNWYLFRANGWAFYIVLVLFACQNWDLVITNFNVQKSKKIDKYYLLSLDSPSVIPELLMLPKNNTDIPDIPPDNYSTYDPYRHAAYDYNSDHTDNWYSGKSDFTEQLHRRMYKFLSNYEGSGWQSWNRGDKETCRKLYELSDKGVFKNLVLKNMALDSLGMIRLFSRIEELDISLNHIGNLKDFSTFSKLTSLNLGFNELYSIKDLPALPGLKKLWLNNNRITDFSGIKKQKSLEYLNLSNNSGPLDLKMLSGLKDLKELDLGNNNIEDYSPLKNLHALSSLTLSTQQVKDFKTLPEFTTLEEADFSNDYLDNNIMEVLKKISKSTNLKKLNLSGNQLKGFIVLTDYYEEYQGFFNMFKTVVPVEPLFPKLEELDLSRNNIFQLEMLDYFKSLKKLDISGNMISNISGLSKLTKLEVLNITDTKTSSIDSLSSLTNLKELNISNNQITDITALRHLKNLEKFTASSCMIQDFSPLSGLSKLRILKLNSTSIRDFSFVKNLKSLEILDISGCNVTDFSYLYGLENLKVLYLDYYVDKKMRDDLKDKLSGVQIVYGGNYYSR